MTITADLAGRSAAAREFGAPPSGSLRAENFAAVLRSKQVSRDGKKYFQLSGDASTVDEGYSMWDMFGPFTEKVNSGAFDKTLAASPDVAFLVNHTGLSMARTTNGTLELSTNPNLHSEAFLNPTRTDVQNLVAAVDDETVDQMSFAFRIVEGEWSSDWTEYHIMEVDLDRGDVSAVNYGANPNTSISARARQLFEAIDTLEGPALRAAQERLAARLGAGEELPAPAVRGSSVAFLAAQLEAGVI